MKTNPTTSAASINPFIGAVNTSVIPCGFDGGMFCGKEYIVEELKETSFTDRGIQIALFSAGGSISEKYAPIAA
ncbi:hypothetical protein ACTPEM_23345, partial [Clostridioides difficile]